MALRTFSYAVMLGLLCALAPSAHAVDVPQSFTLDGQLFSDAAATSPLIDGSIQLTVQILDETKTCILYEETQPVSTLASKGYFTVQVGTVVGSTNRTSGDSGNTMANIFQNVTAINGKLLTNGGPCAGAAVGGQRRFVRIAITPSTMGSVARTLAPDLTIDSVPNAIVAERAESLQGLRGTDVLKVNTAAGTALSQSNLESLFTSATRFNSLTAIVDGTSTNYMRSNSNSGAQLPVLPGAPTTPPIGAIWFDSSDSKIKFQTSVGPTTLGTGAGSVTSVGMTVPTELTVTGAPVTTSGTIAVTWANQTTGKVFAAPNGSTGVPTFRSLVAADAPFAIQNLGGTPSLQSGLDAGKGSATTAGRIWIATDTKLIYRDNGTTWDQIAGASSPTGAAGGDLSGTYPNPGVAKIQGAAVSATTPLDGQVFKFSSSTWTPSNFSIGDLKTATGTQQFAGSAACTSAQTLTWSSLTDTFACATIAGLDAGAITTGTIAAARLPASSSLWTATGGSDIYRTSGNVGIGTTTPSQKLDVQGNIGIGANMIGGGLSYGCPSCGTSTAIELYNSGTGAMNFFGSDNGGNGAGFNFYTSGVHRFKINDNGNVGVGTSTPQIKFAVTGSSQAPTGTGTDGIAQFSTGTGALTDEKISFGFADGLYGWLQALKPGTAYRDLAINPLGGRLMIGTTSPVNLAPVSIVGNDGTISLKGTGNAQYSGANMFSDAGTLSASFQWGNSGSAFPNSMFMGTRVAGAPLIFLTGAGQNERMRIDGAGNLGIGTATPARLLHVNGPMRMTASALPGSPATGDMAVDSGDSNKFKVYDGSTWQVLGASGGAATSVAAGNGTAAAPSVSFSGDADTGFFSGGANVIGVSTGGSTIFNFSSAGLVSPSTGGASVTTANGVAATPTYSFAGDTGTGWFRAAASTLAASTGGAERIRIDSSGNVGIGTATTTARLTIVGPNAVSGSAPNAITATGGSGAATNGNGGGFSFTGGTGAGTGTGGGFTFAAGNASAFTTGAGGSVNLTGGVGGFNFGSGAALTLTGGGVTASKGGSVTLTSGIGGDNDVSGSVDITGADGPYTDIAETAVGGVVNIKGGRGGPISGGAGSAVNIIGGAGTSNSSGGNVAIDGGAKAGSGANGNVILAAIRGNVGVGATAPAEKLAVTGNISATGQTYSGQSIVSTGASVDFNTGNLQVLQSVGGSAITLSNMKDGGSYIVVVTDTTVRTYTFAGCTIAKFNPVNAPTTASTNTIYNILKTTIGGSATCFISWSSGYQ